MKKAIGYLLFYIAVDTVLYKIGFTATPVIFISIALAVGIEWMTSKE